MCDSSREIVDDFIREAMMKAKVMAAKASTAIDKNSYGVTVRIKHPLLALVQKDAEENFRTISKEINLLICKGLGVNPKDYI